MSVPVSKAVLLRQTPIAGFTDPAAAVQFAERVAGRYRRPALHDAITTGLVPRLRKLVKQARDTGELWPDLIEQFRLLVTAGDRLRPTNVALIAVVHHPRPLRFRPLATMSVPEYRASDPLRIPELHQPVFW